MNITRWFKQHRLSLIGLSSLLLVCWMASSPQAQVLNPQAATADGFVDSIGVATHLRYLDTSYGRYEAVIKPRLLELGIRHIRDGGKDPEFFRRVNDLAKSGIKSTLVMDSRDGITPANAVETAIKPVLRSIDAIEGPNEWDVQPQLTYNGKAFPEGLRDYQNALYAAVQGDPATRGIPVVMPSLAMPHNSVRLGYLSSLDLGNMHSYAGGNLPSEDLDTKWIPNTRLVSGTGKSIVATECGWHNAVQDPNASQPGVSDQAAAKYIPRLFLEYYKRGVRRAYAYELLNQRPSGSQEDSFGLLKSTGEPKPAFTALRNLIQLLKDPGPSFQTQPLRFTISGNTQNLNHLLLQKRDRRFYLILWREVRSFDLQTKSNLSVAEAAQSVTLRLNNPIARAIAYLPVNSTQAVWQTSNPTQLQLNVPDHPLILELTPRA